MRPTQQTSRPRHRLGSPSLARRLLIAVTLALAATGLTSIAAASTPTRAAVVNTSTPTRLMQASGVAPRSEAAGPSGPGPVGVTTVGAWWQAGSGDFEPSNLWVFDPVDEALPYGWRKGYQPTGIITPLAQQFSFTYTQSGNELTLSYPSGTRQQLTLLGYDSNGDVLTVNWEGYVQQWVGCRSGQMPPVAAAACR